MRFLLEIPMERRGYSSVGELLTAEQEVQLLFSPFPLPSAQILQREVGKLLWDVGGCAGQGMWGGNFFGSTKALEKCRGCALGEEQLTGTAQGKSGSARASLWV